MIFQTKARLDDQDLNTLILILIGRLVIPDNIPLICESSLSVLPICLTYHLF